MKQKFFMWRYLFIGALFLILNLHSEAQSLKRQSIGSAGPNLLVGGIAMQQSVGQPYFTVAHYSSEGSYLPGFVQPSKLNVAESIHARLNISMDVYPNPSRGSVNIELPVTLSSAKVQVRDMQGRLLVDEHVAGFRKYFINCADWQNGFYLVNLFDDENNSYSSKFIINK